jgi:type I restriction enzyme S subunit
VKEGKLNLSKPEKKAKQINKGLFGIPSNWTWCSLNDILRVYGRIGFRGYTKDDLRRSKEEGAITISPSNMVNGKMDYSECTYISNEKYEESPEIKIQIGDILIVKTGSSFGKTVIVNELPWKATINPQIAVIKDVCVNKEYVTYFLQSPYTQDKFKEFVLGTSIPTFSQTNLINIPIPLPPLAEQRRIVAKIEEMLPLVEQYGKAQAELDELNSALPDKLKKSVLQEAIQGRLVPQDANDEPASELLKRIRKEKERLVKEGKLKKKDLESKPIVDDEIPFEIPKGWEWCRLGEIVNYYTGKTPERGNSKYWDNGNQPWVSISDMKQGKFVVHTKECITKEAAEKCFNYRISVAGSLIMSFKLTVGRTSILGINAYHNEAIITIETLSDINNYIRNYLFHILPIVTTWGDSKDAIKGKTLNSKSIYNLLIPLPPLSEQRRIVAKIEELFKKIDGLKG